MNGQVVDRLTILNQETAVVTAHSGAISSNEVTVNRGTVTDPLVTSVSPSSGSPGDTLTVTVSGANFQPGAVVSFGEGIAVNSVRFVNPNQLVANITIDPNAQVSTGGRTVTVTNPDGGSGSLADAFLVVTPGAAPAPIINSIFPSSSPLRDPNTILMTITGLNFQTAGIGAQVGFSPGGISIVGTPAVSSTQIVVTIRVGITVPAGEVFDVTVTNPADGGTDTLSAAFTAN